MSLTALPTEVLEKVLIWLTAKDVCRLNQVCKAFHAIDKAPVYRKIAELKYGHDLAHHTGRCYERKSSRRSRRSGGSGQQGSKWLEMLKDDNLRGGAMPTIESDSWKSVCKANDYTTFECCLVSRICLDRAAKMIWVYFDARGAPKLHYPLLSCIITILEGRDSRVGLQATKFTSFLDKSVTVGHYKGVLGFPVREFIPHPRGKFYFCYGGSSIFNGNFEPIEIFEIAIDDHRGFFTSFSKLGCKYSSNELHPYTNDGDDVEEKRWQPHIPQTAIYLFKK